MFIRLHGLDSDIATLSFGLAPDSRMLHAPPRPPPAPHSPPLALLPPRLATLVMDFCLQAEYKNLLIQAEMMEMKTRVSGEISFRHFRTACTEHNALNIHRYLASSNPSVMVSWGRRGRGPGTRCWSGWGRPSGPRWRRGWRPRTGRSGTTRRPCTSARSRWTAPRPS